MADVAYREVYAMNNVEARKLLIRTFQDTRSISATARQWHTSCQVVRKWHRRFQQEGEAGLRDRSRRPHHSPNQTSQQLEALVLQAREATGYGRERLALYLQRQGVDLSPYTIRNMLRRHSVLRSKRQRRKPLYPAHWAWDEDVPFSLIQADVKDILDKKALGTTLWQHIRSHHLPRYQWTACEGRSRLRFLAYSHHITRTNGMAFLLLVLMWVRAHGISTPVTFQTDWGNEFGGDNPQHIAELEQRFLQPLNGALRRYPMGRKQYNGRVERSHRTDDEEFYRPYLLQTKDDQHLVNVAARWLYYYNVLRPHLGKQMDKSTPLQVLQRLGYNGPDRIALLPPILLASISTDLLLACDPKGANDLLAYYNPARCPRHAIQFMNYGYGEYVEQVLELAGIDAARMELRQYELWTPYQFASPHDRLQGTAKDEP
jgi:transposase